MQERRWVIESTKKNDVSAMIVKLIQGYTRPFYFKKHVFQGRLKVS